MPGRSSGRPGFANGHRTLKLRERELGQLFDGLAGPSRDGAQILPRLVQDARELRFAQLGNSDLFTEGSDEALLDWRGLLGSGGRRVCSASLASRVALAFAGGVERSLVPEGLVQLGLGSLPSVRRRAAS